MTEFIEKQGNCMVVYWIDWSYKGVINGSTLPMGYVENISANHCGISRKMHKVFLARQSDKVEEK